LIDCDGQNSDGTLINPVYQQSTHYGKYPFPSYYLSGIGPNKTEYEYAKGVTEVSYLKVKNITLGYTLPKKWINKIGVRNLRLYATVTNPFVFTDYDGYDPEWAGAEEGSDGLSTVTWEFGVNLKF